MGQDYWILNADKKLILNPLQYDAGGKMFEHCFIGNSYLYELLHLLGMNGKGIACLTAGIMQQISLKNTTLNMDSTTIVYSNIEMNAAAVLEY